MYNIDYTYLTELEVDTRQTFTDLSDDLLLVYNSNTGLDNTFTAKTLVSSWQDYFWKTNNSNKKDLNITFTDLIIEHDGSKDYQGKALDQDEMMTYKELTSFLHSLDVDRKWAGNRNFTELCCALTAAINAMHGHMTISKLYPKGSIVVDSSTGPNTSSVSWAKQSATYIAENMISEMAGTDLASMGYHTGRTMNSIDIGEDLKRAKITPALSSAGVAPVHTHQLKFDPESGGNSGGNPDGTDVLSSACTYKNVRPGAEYSGNFTHAGIHHITSACHLAVAQDASVSKGDHDSMSPTFSVSQTTIAPENSSIYVAPAAYPLSAYIWESRG